jgi:hypothetical protein
MFFSIETMYVNEFFQKNFLILVALCPVNYCTCAPCPPLFGALKGVLKIFNKTGVMK